MAPISEEKRMELHRKFDEFIDSPSTLSADVTVLSEYLGYNPKTSPIQGLLPADEVEERLDIASQIQAAKLEGLDEDDDLRATLLLTAMELSIIMVIPLDKLREIKEKIPYGDIHCLVRTVLQKGGSKFIETGNPTSVSRKRKSYPDSDGDLEDDLEYSPATEGKNRKNRDEVEVAKCRMRDHASCVFLGSANPEACHIIPFAINSTNDSRKEMFDIREALIIGAVEARNHSSLLYQGIRCSDKAWNMLLLNRQMHKWWSECYFAIKCLGITPVGEGQSEIQLQFHWMPRTQQALDKAETGAKGKGKGKHEPRKWERQIDLANGQGREFVDSWMGKDFNGTTNVLPGGGVVSAADAISGRHLHSGRVIEIPMDTEDAHKMKVMVDLQWACIQVAVLSGAAGSPEFLSDPSPKEKAKAESDAWWTAWYARRAGEHIDITGTEASSVHSRGTSSPNIQTESMPVNPPTGPESREEPAEKRTETSPE